MPGHELGITDASTANPSQAAMAAAASFTAGGPAPLLAALLLPGAHALRGIVAVTVFTLAALGAAGARAGGASLLPGIVRVVIWGSAAMGRRRPSGMCFMLR